MFFAIRDDDLNYFTVPLEIENIYKTIWEECPISFSTVPFHGCTKSEAIPEKYWKGDKNFPIGDNTLLVKFLKKKITEGKICITLHGVEHKDNFKDGLIQFEFETDSDLTDKVYSAKQYLQNLFENPVKVFVPPHNAISKNGLEAIISNNLNLANIVSFFNRDKWFRSSILTPTLKKKIFEYHNKCKFYPYVLNFDDHKEVHCTSLVPKTKLTNLIDKFNLAYKFDGVFILATHYWEYNKQCVYHRNWKMKDVLYHFWDYVCTHSNVNFVDLNRLFEIK